MRSSVSPGKLSSSRRVVVTGIGLVSPVGIGVDEPWQALLEGESGIRLISKFDVSQYSSKIAGEVRGFDPLNFMEKKEARKMDPFIQYAMAAAEIAVRDSSNSPARLEGDRTGVYVGSGIGGIGSIEENHSILLQKGPMRVSPFFLIAWISSQA